MRGKTLTDFLADSYAFFGLADGHASYKRVFAENDVVTTPLNVVEVYAVLLRRDTEGAKAREFAESCLTLAVEVPRETSFRAAEFRVEMIAGKRNCSHIDAWGYAAAETLGRKFLTGDEAFRGLPNVHFLK